ncbi:MAG: Nif3-like dinuclear metal center hexameric protein [Armatimonadetes bacterium]|nr:Nif3-like dinuclear metal center hexameric protein [Armatimonadota bacterium]
MTRVRHVLQALEAIAPKRLAYSFDKIGLQVGDPDSPVEKVVVALDPSLAAAQFTAESQAQMLICHHPVIWDPLKSLRFDNHQGRVIQALVEARVAFAAAHTNWDCAPGGISDVLAELLGLVDVEEFGSSNPRELFKIVVTTPTGTEDALIDAMASAGAGEIGRYDRCSWKVEGVGSFRALEGANPTLGMIGEPETVDEVRVEMVVSAEKLAAVRKALVRAHSYEEPAIDVYPQHSEGGQMIGRVGSLPSALDANGLREMLDRCLNTRSLVCAPPGKSIERIAVVGGAAADEWKNARSAGADALVTGEVPHHTMVEASEGGLAIAAAGHYATENPGTKRLCERLAADLSDVELLWFEPDPGTSGRPSV